MHELQKNILGRFIDQPICRYRDMKPKAIDGNLFTYHLGQLIKRGYIKKAETGYSLTESGLSYIDSLSRDNFLPRIQPKIVSLIACRNDQGEWLLYQRHRQPFYNLIGFPYGKIHIGETVHQAATRELREKTGIQAELSHVGDAYITTTKNDQVFTQMFCHIFIGQQPKGSLIEHSEIGKSFWKSIDPNRKSEYFPGFWDIYQLLNQQCSDHFFKELHYALR